MSADLLVVIEAVEKNTAAISRVAQNLEASSSKMEAAFKKIERAQRETGNGTKTLGEKFRQLAIGAIRQLGNALVNLAVRAVRGVITAMVEATRTAIEYEKAIAEVATLADRGAITQAELARSVKNVTKEFGGNLAGQARALYQAISAGAETGAESIKVLEVANKLAIGGVTDQATAIDGLTSVLNAYGLDMEAFSDVVAQKFFTAMRKGKTTVGELAASIGVLAPTAKAAGISLDEMFGAVSAITKGGIKTETAVISFNQALVAMLKPTKDAKEAAKELGIEWGAGALRAKGFAGVMEDIRRAGGDNSETMVRLFGNVRALRAALALSNNQGVEFAETVNAMRENVTDADDAFETMTGTLAHQIELMDAAGESAADSFGKIVSGSDAAKESVLGLRTAYVGLDSIFTKMAENGAADKIIGELVTLAKFNPALTSTVVALEALKDALVDEGKAADLNKATIAALKKSYLDVTQKMMSLDEDADSNGQALTVLTNRWEDLIRKMREAGLTEKQIAEIQAQAGRIQSAKIEQIGKEIRETDKLNRAKKREGKTSQEESEKAAKAADALDAKLDRMYTRAMKHKDAADRKAMRGIAKDFKSDLREEAKNEKARNRILKKKRTAAAIARRQELREEQRIAESIARTGANAIISILDVAASETQNKGEEILAIFENILKRLASNALVGILTSFIPGGAAIGGIGSLLFGAHGGIVPHGLTSKPVKMDTGGILRGGQAGKDSIPVIAKSGEEFLTRQDRRIVDKALSSRGSTNNISVTVAVPNKPPSKAETYRWAAQELGPVLNRAIRDGVVKIG